jgi:hypothetical protein
MDEPHCFLRDVEDRDECHAVFRPQNLNFYISIV